ncbi:PaaI family thioesterase [Cellulomonas endophytica]|uniref:PaaI family thioesterase n=1 Tax=Cellulomonas endophytica TaxID=2494735 RepID=UPI00101370B7|nr:PaaI family thioesterase [Cellulomonas endophytica]
MTDTDPAAPPAVPGTDRAGAFDPGTLMGRMGLRLVEVSPERTVATMPVVGNTQPFGLLHGGATAVLVETLGSYAAQAHAGPDRRAVGIELSVTHHRSAAAGVVTGTATPLHRGGTLATYEVIVVDGSGRRVATGRLTCMLLAARA